MVLTPSSPSRGLPADGTPMNSEAEQLTGLALAMLRHVNKLVLIDPSTGTIGSEGIHSLLRHALRDERPPWPEFFSIFYDPVAAVADNVPGSDAARPQTHIVTVRGGYGVPSNPTAADVRIRRNLRRYAGNYAILGGTATAWYLLRRPTALLTVGSFAAFVAKPDGAFVVPIVNVPVDRERSLFLGRALIGVSLVVGILTGAIGSISRFGTLLALATIGHAALRVSDDASE
eukprot:TRINITY_DN36353_c0_g1_i1.p1 TRINITY_DN36353_c0_g1~~TRINITY_DN36353_c0_g1_i1.p1  ORF type:complete len:231 (+),score=23.56 TRINITY_DN36353_c0_g1_i1:71-763(+)